MNEHGQDAEAIFLAALEKATPQERAAYVEGACAGKPELLQRVRELLQAHEQSRGPLDMPPPGLGVAVGLLPISEQPGTQIGLYKLLQQLGEGGMGTVYMAEQQEPVRRMVALKIIKAGMDSKQVIARFEVERRSLALMDHPNIARVLDAGTTPTDRPYFVMELVKGIPITQFCDERRLSPRQRLELFVPVCRAVQHAHQKGIIHRDLKPSNVLVALYDGQPVPKVIDFGVAKATGQKLTERTLFTDFGSIVGTLEYMSPEQAELNQLDIDTRSDIYSLGVLLYELLTGSTPLDRKRLKEGALLEALRLIREEEPPRPSQRLSTSQALATLSAQRATEPAQLARLVRGDLDWIVMKALEKDRNRRYETANGLAVDIQHYLHDEPVQAGPPSAAYRLRKFVKRNRGPVLAAVLVLVALVAGVIGTTMGLVRAVQSEQDAVKGWAEAKTNEQKAKEAAAKEKAARELAEENERVANFQTLRAESARNAIQIKLALQGWQRHDVAEAERVLDDMDVRFQPTWEWRFLRDLCHRKVVRLSGHTDIINCLALTGDGQHIVTGSGDNTVILSDTATAKARFTLRHPDRVISVAFSADGQRIFSASADGTVKYWDAATGKELHQISLRGDQWRWAFSPDGQFIVTSGRANLVRVWDVATGQQKLALQGHSDRISSLAVSADGKHIVSGSFDKTAKVWDAATGQDLFTLQGHKGEVDAVAISADGRYIASAGRQNVEPKYAELKVWDAATGKERHALKGHPNYIHSADGRHIASSYWYGSVKVWDVESGQEKLTLNFDEARCVAISADGNRIVSAGPKYVNVWNAAAAPEKLKLHIADAAVVALDPTGSKFAAVSGDGTLRLFDAATAQEKLALKGFATDPAHVALSGNGQRIVAQDQGGVVKVLDGSTGQEERILNEHKGSVRMLVVSADGSHIASVSADGTVQVWDVATGQAKLTLSTMPLPSFLAVSADGKSIAAAIDKRTPKVWDVTTGQQKHILQGGHKGTVCSAAFSADGKQIVTAGGRPNLNFGVNLGAYGEVCVWDAETGKLLLALKGHANIVYSVAFSPDGTRIVSGSWDGTVRIWDAKTGQEMVSLAVHTRLVMPVAWSADGQRIVAAGINIEDGWQSAVTVWEAPLAKFALPRPK
jgi:WD40 repeat protein/serine/threonine protein kinase